MALRLATAALLGSLTLGAALTGCGLIGDAGSLDDAGSSGDGGGGSDAGGGGAPVHAGESTGIPCDVDETLQKRCQNCHGNSPIGGAPMPLVTWDDLQAKAVSEPDLQVFELALQRIADTEKPMPPGGSEALTTEERAALGEWLGQGAPRSDEACGVVDPEEEEPWGIDALDCEPSHVFTSHAPGNVDAPFELPPDAVNSYYCFGFQVPWDAQTEGTAIAPILGDERVIHHVILYTTSQPLEHEGVFPCEVMPLDSQFVAGFQPTAPQNIVMPDDVGLELPNPGQWMFMQVHYWNAAGLTDVADKTGVAFCTSDEPRPQQAGILWLGTIAISIPPYAKDVSTSGCWTAPTDLNIMASGPHMHQLGSKFTTELHRLDGTVDPVVKVDPWDFDNQEMPLHDEPIKVNAGDTFRVNCNYDNPTSRWVGFGERSEDEMCFDFTLVYPVAQLGSDRRYWTPCL